MQMKQNKIAIVTSSPLSLAPYIKFYMKVLDNYKIEYIVITTYEEDQDYSDKVKVFKNKFKHGLFNILYRRIKGILFVIREIRANSCNKLIVSPTRTGYRLAPYLIVLMHNKYILDIRDLTREKQWVFRNVERLLIKQSYCTFLSSKGFTKVIKKHSKIHYIHNVLNISSIAENRKYFSNKKINIVSAGMISYPKVNLEMMEKTKNSNIELYYHGLVTNEWENFFENYEYPKHVILHGKYNEDRKKELYENADFINNVYESQEFNAKYLTTNRIYDSARYRIPIIVSKNSFLEELVNHYKIGIAVDIYKENILELLNKFVEEFNDAQFIKNCDRFMEDVFSEQNKAKSIIYEFVHKS
jgi:hypothetical protein